MGDSGIMFSNFLDPIAKVWGNDSSAIRSMSSGSFKNSIKKHKKLKKKLPKT